MKSTPHRLNRWFEADSLNISGQKGLKDTLEESKMSGNDSKIAVNKQDEHKVLSVCFERSASQKNVRKSRQSTSPRVLLKPKARPRSALSMSSKLGGSRRRQSRKVLPKGKLINGEGKVPAKSGEQSPSGSEKGEITINLRLTEKAAATVIQKEVRKYLGSMGFYEARLPGQQSPRLCSPE